MSGKRLSRIVVLTLAVWLIGAAETAYGQGNTWPGEGLAQMVQAARWRLGALRLNAAFTLANAGYDSDIYFGSLGDPVPDWTFAAGVPAQVLLPLSKNIVLDLSDTPQYLFYAATERERTWNNVFKGQVHFALERVYVQAGGGMSDVRTRLSPELYINVREKRDSLEGLVLVQASKATSFALSYKRAAYDYGDAEYLGTRIAERLNRDEDLFDMVTYIQPSPRKRLFVDGQYGIYTFTGGTSRINDARSFGIFGGIDFIPRAGEETIRNGIEGGFKLGYMRLDMVDPGQTDGSGFAGEADISARLSRRTSAHLAFSRGFEFSVFAGATFYLSTEFRAGLSQRLSRRSTLSYEGSLGMTSYPEEGSILGLSDRFMGHMLSMDIRLARYLQVTLLGTFMRRTRETVEVPRDRYFFGLNLTYGSPGRGMSSVLGMLAR